MEVEQANEEKDIFMVKRLAQRAISAKPSPVKPMIEDLEKQQKTIRLKQIMNNNREKRRKKRAVIVKKKSK